MRAILFSLFSLPVLLSAQEITWARQDFPPAYLDNHQGYLDKYLSIVQSYMPEYKHSYLEANFARTLESMKKGQKVCSMGMLKNMDRKEVVHYSSPYLLIPANHIIMLKNNIPNNSLITENQKIDLTQYLSSNKKIGVAAGRSYGEKVDNLLKSSSENIIIRGGTDVFEGLFAMLSRGRLDAILGYPMELHWFSKDLKTKLKSYPLKDEDEYIYGYVGCTKNEWGQKMISHIDKNLRKLRTQPEFYQIYLDYLPFADRKEYINEINKRFKP